jgi:hypothetical protein
MKFIKVSLLSLASLVVITSAKAAILDRVPTDSTTIVQEQTTQARPVQLAATLKSGTFVRGEQATRKTVARFYNSIQDSKLLAKGQI